eukprot:TRINITY_DN45883_c0_g1_i1.p1 TRINITY_DN45883_c0_g1~~TRINITY_DN45883_c0_g1_i1.p1  ORF type:complete len:502 (-),score=103.68 TRINITY_DN45883_c0_g1_i1:98-1474(-)
MRPLSRAGWLRAGSARHVASALRRWQARVAEHSHLGRAVAGGSGEATLLTFAEAAGTLALLVQSIAEIAVEACMKCPVEAVVLGGGESLSRSLSASLRVALQPALVAALRAAEAAAHGWRERPSSEEELVLALECARSLAGLPDRSGNRSESSQARVGAFGRTAAACRGAAAAEELATQASGAEAADGDGAGRRVWACAGIGSCLSFAERLVDMGEQLVDAAWRAQAGWDASMVWLLHGRPARLRGRGVTFRCAGAPRAHCELLELVRLLGESSDKRKSINVIEVGVHEGTAAEMLLDAEPRLRYLGVDPYTGSYQGEAAAWGSGDLGDAALYSRTRARLRRFGKRASICRRPSALAARMGSAACGGTPWPWHRRRPRGSGRAWRPLADIVFIDGLHDFESVLEDIRLWTQHVRRGGIIAGHDYRFPWPGVPLAVHASLPHGKSLHLAADAVWWWQKP